MNWLIAVPMYLDMLSLPMNLIRENPTTFYKILMSEVDGNV